MYDDDEVIYLCVYDGVALTPCEPISFLQYIQPIIK